MITNVCSVQPSQFWTTRPVPIPLRFVDLEEGQRAKVVQRFHLLPYLFLGQFTRVKELFEREFEKYCYTVTDQSDLREAVQAILKAYREGNALAFFDLQFCSFFDVEPEGWMNQEKEPPTSQGEVINIHALFQNIFKLSKNRINQASFWEFQIYKDTLLPYSVEFEKPLLLIKALLCKDKDEKALEIISRLEPDECVQAVRQAILDHNGEKLKKLVAAVFVQENGELADFTIDGLPSNLHFFESSRTELVDLQQKIRETAQKPYSLEIKQEVAEGITQYKTKQKAFLTYACSMQQNRCLYRMAFTFSKLLKITNPIIHPNYLFYTSDCDYTPECKKRLGNFFDVYSSLDGCFGDALKWQEIEEMRPDMPPQTWSEWDLDAPLLVIEKCLVLLLKNERWSPQILSQVRKLSKAPENYQVRLIFLFYLVQNPNPSWGEIDPLLKNFTANLITDGNLEFVASVMISILALLEGQVSSYPQPAQSKIEQKVDELWANPILKSAMTTLADNGNPAALLFYARHARRKGELETAAQYAQRMIPFDQGEQLELVAKQCLSQQVFGLSFGYFLILKHSKQPKYALINGLFHAFEKIAGCQIDAAIEAYEEAKESGGWWLLHHLKYTQNIAKIELPKDLPGMDSKLACECLNLFEPEMNWSRQKLLDLAKESPWEKEGVQFEQEVNAVNDSIRAAVLREQVIEEGKEFLQQPKKKAKEKEDLVLWSSKKNELLGGLKRQLEQLKQTQIAEQLKEEAKICTEKALKQLEEGEEKAKARVAQVFKKAKEKAAELGQIPAQALPDNFGKIQKEAEEHLSREQELVELRQQLKMMEQKNRELEKSLALKEQEREQETLLVDMAKEWIQEISEKEPLGPQNIIQRVSEKIDNLFAKDPELAAKVSKQFWEVKEDPTPVKKEMVALLNLLGFQQKGAQRGSHIAFMKDKLFCLFWTHESRLSPPEKRACLKRVLQALEN